MHFLSTSIISSAALFAALSNAAAVHKRQGWEMPAGPSPTCVDWNPKGEDGYDTVAGSSGDNSGTYCLNGRICYPSIGVTNSELEGWIEEYGVYCPDDCTTDGNKECV